MTTTRRAILGATAIVPLALAGCASQTTTQLQADVKAITSGLTGVMAALGQIPGVATNAHDQALLAQAQQELAVVQSDGAAIASALTPNASVVTTFTSAITAFVPLVTPFFPMAPAVAAVVEAAASLVSVVLAEAGIAAAGLKTPRPTMSPSAARMILGG